MDCPVCGTANEAGAAFCYRCGSALRPAASPAQQPATGQTIDLSREPRRPTTDQLDASRWGEAAEPGRPDLRSPLPSVPSSIEPAGGARVYQSPGSSPPRYVVGPAPATTSNMAVLSLILGIVSWVFLPFLAAIGAVITGHMARREITSSGGRLTGDGLALAGLILGYLNLALIGLVAVCFVIFVVLGVASSSP